MRRWLAALLLASSATLCEAWLAPTALPLHLNSAPVRRSAGAPKCTQNICHLAPCTCYCAIFGQVSPSLENIFFWKFPSSWLAHSSCSLLIFVSFLTVCPYHGTGITHFSCQLKPCNRRQALVWCVRILGMHNAVDNDWASTWMLGRGTCSFTCAHDHDDCFSSIHEEHKTVCTWVIFGHLSTQYPHAAMRCQQAVAEGRHSVDFISNPQILCTFSA